MIVSLTQTSFLSGMVRTCPTIAAILLPGVDCNRGRKGSRMDWTAAPHFFVPTLT